MKYGVIGEHLKHSFSKEIHSVIADYSYEIKEIEPHDLDEFMKKADFNGINVTIPYKEKVIPYLYSVSDSAKEIGAVNTVVNREGKLYGYNTDFSGMCALIKRIGLDLTDKKVLILGTGGTSKTAHAVATSLGAKEIITASRTKTESTYTYDEIKENHRDTQVIINTTPVGMYPKNEFTPIDVSVFPKLEGVVDAVYNPIRTNLVLDARQRGIKAQGGLYMLSAQAVYASEHFTGSKMSEEVCEKAYNKVLKDKENIVLIGMPSCGKTTVGGKIARALKREFVDTDDEIVKIIGMDIPTFFFQKGEKEFRDIEEKVIAEVSKRSGIVIATGGGAILRESNVRNLKQNGRIYFINRPLRLLRPTKSRPLSSDYEALRLRYEQRFPIYKSSCDVEIISNKTSGRCAREITEEFFK